MKVEMLTMMFLVDNLQHQRLQGRTHQLFEGSLRYEHSGRIIIVSSGQGYGKLSGMIWKPDVTYSGGVLTNYFMIKAQVGWRQILSSIIVCVNIF